MPRVIIEFSATAVLVSLTKNKMRVAVCLLLCFLFTYNPTLGGMNEWMEVVNIMLQNRGNINEVIAIIKNVVGISEDDKAKMIKEVEKYGNQHRVGGFYDVVVHANSLKGNHLPSHLPSHLHSFSPYFIS